MKYLILIFFLVTSSTAFSELKCILRPYNVPGQYPIGFIPYPNGIFWWGTNSGGWDELGFKAQACTGDQPYDAEDGFEKNFERWVAKLKSETGCKLEPFDCSIVTYDSTCSFRSSNENGDAMCEKAVTIKIDKFYLAGLHDVPVSSGESGEGKQVIGCFWREGGYLDKSYRKDMKKVNDSVTGKEILTLDKTSKVGQDLDEYGKKYLVPKARKAIDYLRSKKICK